MAAVADGSTAPEKTPERAVFVKTYGCQMNVYDSERMGEALAADGYRTVDTPEAADLVILNTCHIREKAAEKIYSELGRLRPLVEARAAEGGKLSIGVAGCVAQAEGAEIRRRQPLVDFVVGPQAYHRLPALASRARGGEAVIDTEFPEEDKFDHLPARRRGAVRARGPTAFLTIQEGCDKFCAFCVVPYTRGAEVSRPVARVLNEARALVDAGAREITLLGQNVNAYHGAAPEGAAGPAEWGLGRLLEALATLPGVARLRYTTSHPNDMDDALIAAHRDIPAVMPYLHLPVQAGADRILKAMNRKHTAADYLRIVERLRAARPDLALSSDFIVGFPGETEADFQATLDLVAEVGFAQAYSFKYSPRPGTPAAEKAQVAEGEKAERLARLQALLGEQQAAFQRAQLGKTLDVLLEKPGRKPGQLVGRSPYLQAVHMEATPEQLGQIAPVKIIEVGSNSLGGRLAA